MLLPVLLVALLTACSVAGVRWIQLDRRTHSANHLQGEAIQLQLQVDKVTTERDAARGERDAARTDRDKYKPAYDAAESQKAERDKLDRQIQDVLVQMATHRPCLTNDQLNKNWRAGPMPATAPRLRSAATASPSRA